MDENQGALAAYRVRYFHHVHTYACTLFDSLVLYSQLYLLGSPRAGCHPGMCLFRWKALRAHIQRSVLYPKLVVTRPSTFPDDGQWVADIFNGHAIGCNAVSWAPATHPGSLIHPHQPGAPMPPAPFKRFASAGCDNLVKIWSFREDTQTWVEEETLEGHGDWVRDVAWAPNIGLPRSYIATASQVRLAERVGQERDVTLIPSVWS